MISVILCSRDAQAAARVERNVRLTAGAPPAGGQAVYPLEVICVDNSVAGRGICAVYNEGARRAQGDVLVFMHEDVFHLEFGWAAKVETRFSQNPRLGVLGVAGTQVLTAEHPVWTWAGQPWLAGKVVHELDQGQRFFMTVFSTDRGDREVVSVDGLWMAVRRKAWEQHPFDEKTFAGFHFYDHDLCLQMQPDFQVMVSNDVLVKHLSPGGFGALWQEQALVFCQKWAHRLPAVVPGVSLPSQPGSPFFNVDLRGKVSQQTLL